METPPFLQSLRTLRDPYFSTLEGNNSKPFGPRFKPGTAIDQHGRDQVTGPGIADGKSTWEHRISGKPELATTERELRTALAEKMILDWDYLPLPSLMEANLNGAAGKKSKGKGKNNNHSN